MPGIVYYDARDGNPAVRRVMVGKSTVINNGDLLIFTTNSTYTASEKVVRPALSGDTLTVGTLDIAGVAMTNITTNASAVRIDQTPPVTTRNAAVTSGFSGMGEFYNVEDPATGYTGITVYEWCSHNRFLIKPQSDDAFDFSNVNAKYGINCSAASAPATYTLNEDETGNTANCVVEGFLPDDAATLAVAGASGPWVIVRPLDAANAHVTLTAAS